MQELALKISDKPKLDKRIKKGRNGKKLDIMQVLKLRDVHGLKWADISKQLGYSEPYIIKVYQDFRKIMPSHEISESYDANRTNLLSGMEYKMLQNMSNEDKLQKASLNNVAYAFNQIHSARRLEEGKGVAGGVTVNIEVAYQEATELSKALRLKHVGTGAATPIDIEPDLVA